MFSSRRTLLLAVVIIICLTLPVQSAVRYVKADSPGPTLDGTSWSSAYHTVTAGISAALSGDEIWVAKGTYVENITLKDGVALYGGFAGTETSRDQRNWKTNQTILDGNKAGSVVTSPAGVTSSTVVDGFTIRNGSTSSGGGIYCNSSSPTISNNIITANWAGSGGGIYCTSSSPTISNNIITRNTAAASTFGGGLGGGIYCMQMSSPTISNNIITSNAASSGGGIYCSLSSPTITNNTIVSNPADAINCVSSSAPTILNNILAFNYRGVCQSCSTPVIGHNCVYGNLYADSSALCTGAGNISVDPMIAPSADGTCHIQPNSPCRNAGSIPTPGVPSVDFDGQARPEGSAIDIGADESYGETWTLPVIYVATTGNNSNDGLSWGNAKRTMQAAIDMCPANYEIWVAKGTYVENITLKDGVALYGGFAGTEAARAERNRATNETILDGNKTGSVVTVPSGVTSSTMIDGFTIRNGKAVNGGGVYCVSSSPMISNNVITSNAASEFGGGIEISGGSPIVYNNSITTNTADNGGGIFSDAGTPTISGNSISMNTATNYGGGILGIGTVGVGASSSAVSNNTVICNTAPDGGGIACFDWPATFSNNIVAFNSSGIYNDYGTYPLALRKNDVYGNGPYNYSGLSAGSGDICVDPLIMISASGACHIHPNSPCRNAGDVSAPGVPSVDIDGQARPEGSAIDIGADESYGEIISPAIIYVSPNGDDNNDGTSWTTAKKTIKAAINRSAVGMEIWVAKGTYVENITLKNSVTLYGGFAGTETSRDQRNWKTNQTIIDGNRLGSVVTSPSGASASTIIDGFTIRNGLSSYGGGICCKSSSVIISNNYIVSNTAYVSGGGIYCESSSPTISNNTITLNTAGVYGDGFGGGIHCQAASAKILNNSISTNTSTRAGGGVCCVGSSSSTISYNTIVSNTATSYGGGIYCSMSAAPAISNNIVAFNSTGIYSSASPTLRKNDVYGNKSYNYSGLLAGAGDISVDPLVVVSASGACHIQPNSPCRNAGDVPAPGVPAVDFDGQARPEGNATDIGADESYGEAWNPTIIYVSPNGDDNNDGISWATAKKTIKAGLSRSAFGMEVWVAKGTYTENITLKNDVALYGGFAGTETSRDQRNWKTNQTIIDGNRLGSVVTSPSGALASTIIDGFTIRNGKATNGGGIYCDLTSSPTISNNTITISTADSYGGGIYCSAAPTISNNIITSNTASNSGGGGIFCTGGSPTITNNTIASNTGYTGGGIYCSSSSPLVLGNTISGNTSRQSGGGIYCYYGSPMISRNTITSNASTYGGGGIYSSTSSPTIVNNTITSNSASDGDGIYCSGGSPIISNNTIAANITNVTGTTIAYGGGIYCSGGSPAISNNIVAFNPSGIYCTGGTPALRCNCVYGNISSNYSGISPGTGDISVNPMVSVSESGAYHIQPNSPCRNAGDNSAPGVPAVDIDGQVRPEGSAVDIGSDESYGEAWHSMIMHVSPDGNDSNDGFDWSSAKKTIKAALNTSSLLINEVWVSAGTYTENITLKRGVSLYGGFAGNEISRDQRNWKANETIIDGNKAGSVVISPSGVTSSTTIDGFTIRNGKVITNGSAGGGIYCSYSSPTISNNIITSNVAGDLGGGIEICGGSPVISNNTITSNQATFGGGICSEEGSPTITGNIISSNTATECGGGIIWLGQPKAINNNTIVGNTAAVDGGGMACFEGSPDVSNNIVAFNSSGIYKEAGTPWLRNNNVYGNTSYNYLWISAGAGDISVDPLFVNRTAGNYHLLGTSPCINAGWNSATDLPSVDMDGQSRILGGVIDIGADEYQPTGDMASISGAKKSAAGSWIEFSGDIVTASMGDAFYIETENRASGIRVEKPAHTMARSMKAYVFGKIKTNADGEVYIEASLAEQKGHETGSVTPMALTNRALGGSALGLQAGVKDGAGLSNIGLLVRVYGKIVEIDQSATPTWFVIDDGCNTAVKCIIPAGVTIDTERVCVTGISSCEKSGDELHRIIRTRDAKDIAPY